MTRTARRSRSILAIAALVALAAIAPAPVAARDTDIIRRGSCSGASTWKLKLSAENGRIEVEAEVDQNRNGRTWMWTLKKNGTTFATGSATTQALSGSWSVARRTANGAGDETISLRATHPATGEVCTGSAIFPR